MKLNKGGLKLTAVYLCWFAVTSAVALWAPDPKGGWFFGQLSILPFGIVVMLLVLLGFGDLIASVFDNDSWINTGLLSIPISIIVVYLFGWAVSAFAKKMKSVKPDPSMPVIDPPGWSDRK